MKSMYFDSDLALGAGEVARRVHLLCAPPAFHEQIFWSSPDYAADSSHCSRLGKAEAGDSSMGVPAILMWDPGSRLQSGPPKLLCHLEDLLLSVYPFSFSNK